MPGPDFPPSEILLSHTVNTARRRKPNALAAGRERSPSCECKHMVKARAVC